MCSTVQLYPAEIKTLAEASLAAIELQRHKDFYKKIWHRLVTEDESKKLWQESKIKWFLNLRFLPWGEWNEMEFDYHKSCCYQYNYGEIETKIKGLLEASQKTNRAVDVDVEVVAQMHRFIEKTTPAFDRYSNENKTNSAGTILCLSSIMATPGGTLIL